LPQRVPRSLIDLLHRIDLRWRETGRRLRPGALQRLRGIRKHEGRRIEFGPARREIVDDAVGGSVELVAGRQDGAGEEVLIGDRKRRVEDRAAVRKLLDRRRRDGLDRLHPPVLGERDRLQVIDRIAGDDAVVVIGKVLREHHALPAAGGAADEIGAVRGLPVVGVDQELGDLRRRVDRTVGVVVNRLRIEQELVGDGQILVLMPAVLAGDGPAAGECRRQRPGVAGRRGHCAFGAAATLKHETAVPLHRQAHLEAVAIRETVGAGALVDDALHLAMVGQCHAIRRRGAAGIEFGQRDLRRRHRKVHEGCELRARRRGIRWRCGKARRCRQAHGGYADQERPEH